MTAADPFRKTVPTESSRERFVVEVVEPEGDAVAKAATASLDELRDIVAVEKSTTAFMKIAEGQLKRAWDIVQHRVPALGGFLEFQATEEGRAS